MDKIFVFLLCGFRFIARGLHLTVGFTTFYGYTGRQRKRQARILHLHGEL